MPDFDLSKGPIAGMAGKFYWPSGDPMGECTSWEITRGVNMSKETVLNRINDIPVQQGTSYALKFSTLTVTDALPQQLLEADRAKKQLWLDFYAEVERPDGALGKYPVGRCTIDGDLSLFKAESGSTMKRDFSWAIGDIPAPTSYLG